MESMPKKPMEDQDAQLYDYLRSKFDPNTDGYKQRQESERQLAEERRQQSDQMNKQANIQDMIGGMLEAANTGATINGERVVQPGMGTRFSDRASKMRSQAQEIGGQSRQEEMLRKKEEDSALFKYLSDKKDDQYKQQMLDATRTSRADANATKLEDKVAKEVTGLTDKTDPIRNKQFAIESLEKNLGFSLEEFDPDKKQVRGQEINLPGKNVPVFGRISWYNGDARTLDSTMGKIVSEDIKDKAGSTVTNGEMERVRTNWNAGKYNTEEEMIQALKEYKAGLQAELARRELGYRPESLKEYQNRGGELSSDIAKKRVPFNPKNLVGKAKPMGGEAVAESTQKKPVKAGYSKSQNITKVIYSDGTEETLNGDQRGILNGQ